MPYTVCSGVRMVGVPLLGSPPMFFTARNALVYSPLVSFGGGGARNWSALVITNGFTSGQ